MCGPFSGAVKHHCRSVVSLAGHPGVHRADESPGRSHPPAHINTGVDGTIIRLFQAALAPATKRAYRHALGECAKFLGFSSFHSICIPLSEYQVIHYIAFLFNMGLSYPSIVSRLSALSYGLKSRNWPLVTRSFLVMQALRGVRSLSSRQGKNKFPVTPDVLRRLCTVLQQSSYSHYDQCALKAMFLLAFHAFLRVGEICSSRHALSLCDVIMHGSYVRVSFKSFKFSQGRSPHVFIPSHPSMLCPVAALHVFLKVRGTSPGRLFINSSGSPYSVLWFRSALSKISELAGLRAWGITPHSFRVGAATSAAALGIPEDTIQRMGRWSSRAFMRYIKYQVNRL